MLQGHACAAGTWRGREVAIKTLLFECSTPEQAPTEAAIAACLNHSNIVATLHSDVTALSSNATQELDIFKLYLVQVRPAPTHALLACSAPRAMSPAAL